MSVSDELPDPEAAATTLLAAVTRGLSVVREPRLLRQRFEEELRTLVQARSRAAIPTAGSTMTRTRSTRYSTVSWASHPGAPSPRATCSTERRTS